MSVWKMWHLHNRADGERAPWMCSVNRVNVQPIQKLACCAINYWQFGPWMDFWKEPCGILDPYSLSLISAQTDSGCKEPNGPLTQWHLLSCVLHLVPLIRCLTESALIMREVKDRAKPVKRWTAFPLSERQRWLLRMWGLGVGGQRGDGGWAD